MTNSKVNHMTTTNSHMSTISLALSVAWANSQVLRISSVTANRVAHMDMNMKSCPLEPAMNGVSGKELGLLEF